MSLFPGKSIDVHNNRYYSYLLCGCMIYTSLLALFMTAPKIDFSNSKFLRWVIFVGQNTLVFYIMHYDARFVIKKFLQATGLLMESFAAYLAAFVFICISMTLAVLVINRWFPLAAGKRNTNN